MNPDQLEKHYRRLETMYHTAPINHSIPSRLTVSDGEAEIRMTVGEQFWHAGRAMHGCLYFKGLDDAAFFAANSKELDGLMLTVRFEVELLGMVQCSSVRSKGFFERREGRKIWARSEQYDDHDQLVARGSGLFLVSKMPLPQDETDN